MHLKSKSTILKLLLALGLISLIWIFLHTYVYMRLKEYLVNKEFPYDVPDAATLKVDFLHRPAEKICDDIEVIALVTTSLPNLNLRNLIRKFWSEADRLPIKVKPIFMLGFPKTNSKKTNDEITEEANQYKDILQGSFIDSYWNLTVKMINGMRWRYEYCNDPKFVLFHDDDVCVKLSDFVSYSLEHLPSPRNLLKCGLKPFYNIPPDRKGPWAVPQSRYNLTYYPTFCSGPCFLMSGDVASKLYETSQTMVLNIGLTDVTVTGIVRQKSGIEIDKNTEVFADHLQTSDDIESRMKIALEEQLNII